MSVCAVPPGIDAPSLASEATPIAVTLPAAPPAPLLLDAGPAPPIAVTLPVPAHAPTPAPPVLAGAAAEPPRAPIPLLLQIALVLVALVLGFAIGRRWQVSTTHIEGRTPQRSTSTCRTGPSPEG